MQFPSSIRQEFEVEEERDGMPYVIPLAKTPTWCSFHWRVDTLLRAVSGSYSPCINVRPLPVLFPSEDIILCTVYPFIGSVYCLK